VSRNNRVVEWHPSRYGSYWKTNEFKSSKDEETSHRQLNQGRGWTTSRCPVRRLLLVGLALLLRNVWALLHRVALAERRRGGPRLQPALLRLATLLDWLADALKELFGVRREVRAPQPFFL
jgi:hypothetical protein